VGDTQHTTQAGERPVYHRIPHALGESLSRETASSFRIDGDDGKPSMVGTVPEELVELLQPVDFSCPSDVVFSDLFPRST
jgi:hypothetical protein